MKGGAADPWRTYRKDCRSRVVAEACTNTNLRVSTRPQPGAGESYKPGSRGAAEAIARTFGYTFVRNLLDESVLLLQYQVGYDRVAERVSVMEGVSGRVVRMGEAVLLEDDRTEPASNGAIPASSPKSVCTFRKRVGSSAP